MQTPVAAHQLGQRDTVECGKKSLQGLAQHPLQTSKMTVRNAEALGNLLHDHPPVMSTHVP
jgi:hypothetical protein